MIKTLRIFLFVLVFFFVPRFVYATDDFSTSYNVTYTVNSDQTTQAKLDVALTNNTSQYYASSYTLQVGFDTITNVTAKDEAGDIPLKITKNENGNAIALTFDKKVVGIHNKHKFTLTFDTSNVAKKQGKIWEINIPGIANPDEFSDFTVTIVPPSGLGQPTYTKPKTSSGSLTFTKNQLGKSGISLAFGSSQVYRFDLKYHIRNPNIFPIDTEIALPPKTNYQEIAIEQITPQPENVLVDPDGNWLAQYHLSSTQNIDVHVLGSAKISLTPRKEQLSDDRRNLYLRSDQYWQSSDPAIATLAKKLKTPENIYSYVVGKLKYDFTRVNSEQERLGAVQALNNPKQAVCLEFTDLFIALSRAAGIPARELNGFAYTENAKQRPLSLVQDILHAWPEYYDDQKQAWIMVDPTWGNTTGGIDYFTIFDFDHLVFVTKGEESTYPIPAGGYKFEEDKNKKDVDVSFAGRFPSEPAQITITPHIQGAYVAGLPITASITVSNTGKTMPEEDTITVNSDTLMPHTQKIAIPPLPPYGKRDISMQFDNEPFLTNKSYEFTIDASGQTTYHTIRVTPFVLTTIQLLGGSALVILCIIIFIIAYEARRLSVPRRRK